ncbi:MAG: rhodanese-like domain-containing protein [Gemmata sp.]
MIPQIQPSDLKHALDAGQQVTLLDVRQPEENAFCALPGSVLIPLGELTSRIEEVPTEVPVVVYCHHGVRSLTGAAILRGAGIEALSLAGGIDRWSLAVDPAVPRYQLAHTERAAARLAQNRLTPSRCSPRRPSRRPRRPSSGPSSG